MNLKQMLEKAAREYGGRAAFALEDKELSYSTLDKDSDRVANVLLGLGVEKGDRVATLVNTSFEFAIIFFGIAKAGAIAVPLDIRYTPHEMTFLFANCQPKVLIGESPLLTPLIPHLSRFPSIRHVVKLGEGHEGRFADYHKLVKQASTKKIILDISDDDIGTISYTGGPTNHPHGAALAHGNLVAQATASGEGLQQTSDDVVLLYALPMYHNFGLASVMLGSVIRGSTVVIIPGTGRSISSLLEAIEQKRGTIYLGVPYIYSLAISVAQREGVNNDLSSMRFWGSGGAPLSLEIVEQFKQYYGFGVRNLWGLTESVSHVTCPPPDREVMALATGRPIRGYEVKIVEEDSREVSTGQSGEIIVRGPMMKCYYNNPADTARAIKDGWLYTGDIGKMDGDGNLYITGRKKDMLILKGQNIYPWDIEEELAAHPKVAEVRVVGVPDKLRGEVVGAIIRLKPGMTATEQEIRHFCQERMADFKTPKQVIFTDSVLETATSIQRQNPFSHYSARLLLASK